MTSAEGRTPARARRAGAPCLRRRSPEPSPSDDDPASKPGAASLPAIAVLGVATLAALAIGAAGIDLIRPAAARNVSPLLSLVSPQQVPVADAAMVELASAAAMPAVPARVRLVFSLSDVPRQEEILLAAADRARAAVPLPTTKPPAAEWLAALAVHDRTFRVVPGPAPAVLDRPAVAVPGSVPPAALPAKPLARDKAPPLPVLKPLVTASARPAAAPLTVRPKPQASALPAAALAALEPAQWRAPPTVAAALARFESVGFDLDEVRVAARPVPRVYLPELPRDFADVASVDAKKRLFIQTVLPVILRVNEELAAARRRVEQLADRLMWADAIAPADRDWLIAMAEHYGTAPFDVPSLLNRLDVVPPSLAIAQAVEETGWGTSRFALEGNALFGQYTYKSVRGMVPARRDEDRRHRVRRHDTLLDAARSYALNLNTHWAYEDFRHRRASLRKAGNPLDGYDLAGELRHYSERRAAYVQSIREIMRQNRLDDFDEAWLNNLQWTALTGVSSDWPI